MASHPAKRHFPEELPVEWDPIRRALEENEDWYRDLVEHSQDLLCVHDLEGRFLSVNPGPARLLGYSVEEMLQKPMRDFIDPQSRDRFDDYLREIERTGESRGLMAVVRTAAIGLLLVLLQLAVVLLRYVFGIGSIWLSESVIYTHATLFLLAAAWTLQQNGHARVDVFYADASARNKAVVDLLGALLLLLPFMAAIIWYALPYVARSWAVLERSREASGLPLVFLLKSLILLFAVLLGLQGIAQAARAWLALTGAAPAEPGR